MTHGKDEEPYSASTIPVQCPQTAPEMETSFRTTTPSAPAMTAKQALGMQNVQNNSQSGPPAHCAHVYKLPKQVLKPGDS